jgi:nicotinamide mononucleotide transporter
MVGTFCYCYLAYKNGFFGNLLLYGLYYFPMEIIGIFKWIKHLKKDKQEIIKTRLSNKDRIIYTLIAIIFSIIFGIILSFNGGKTPIIDSTTTVLSVIGQLLTVKRCIEQWYIWFIVNLLSLIMWIIAYINGSNCLATVIMWFVYWLLTFYFYYTWTKELKENP